MDELKPDKEGKIHLILNPDDSALVVRTNDTIEIVSREMVENENGYVGDIEDLNKTFSLVLALAASLEDEDLYSRIFYNLNKVLMQQWNSLDDTKKEEIIKIRQQKEKKQSNKDRKEKDKRVDDFKDRINRHRQDYYEDQQRRMMEDLYNEKEFLKRNEAEFAKPKRKIKKKKASLAYLKNIAWDPNDKSLTAHFKEFRADAPPPVEEE